MSGNFITKINDSNIYLINDKNISYFLSIPDNSPRVNIAINIYEGIDSNNVSDVFSLVNRDNLSIISPIFDSSVLNELKNNNQPMFINVDKYLSYLINSVYSILKSNNKEVETKIVLINYDIYSEFNKWFKEKYKERVNSVDVNSDTREFQPMDITNMFHREDLGIPAVNTASGNIASNVLDNTQQMDMLNDEQEGKVRVKTRDLGFVSYVLLGVVVAITSLLLLYLLI